MNLVRFFWGSRADIHMMDCRSSSCRQTDRTPAPIHARPRYTSPPGIGAEGLGKEERRRRSVLAEPAGGTIGLGLRREGFDRACGSRIRRMQSHSTDAAHRCGLVYFAWHYGARNSSKRLRGLIPSCCSLTTGKRKAY